MAAGSFEFLAVHFDAEGGGGDLLFGSGKVKDDESVGVAPGFLFGGSDGEEQFVAGEFFAFLEFFEACPVGSQAFCAAWRFPCCGGAGCGLTHIVRRHSAVV